MIINTAIYNSISLVLVIGILWGINLMSNPRTAVRGNLLGAICLTGAIILTLIHNGIIDRSILWISMAVGAAIGYVWAVKVKMIQMPQLVAMYNGFGGGASALVATLVLVSSGAVDIFSKCTATIALVVGAITLSGSLIAAGKLDQRLPQRSVVFNYHTPISYITLAVLGLLVLITTITPNPRPTALMAITGIASLFFGTFFAIRVGGADMPITISLLNSLSGVAGAIAGLAMYDPLLVAVGGIVGASGLLLTQIMCRSMNRTLFEVLTGGTSAAGNNNKAQKKTNDITSPAVQPGEAPVGVATKEKQKETEPTTAAILKAAEKIIIIPGYGMALAQAQHKVKQLADKLEDAGKEVKFAIHPVAGRMPGHMNVLLAEADVPYEKLYEMEAINPEFPETDVVIIVGANDVVNPAANTAEGTPIYGMPILQAGEAKHIIICNYDTKPGYAGVDNPLYERDNVTMLAGDASETVSKLLAELETS